MKINKILTYIVLSVVIICCLLLLASRFSISGIRLFSVQSGSMEPAIKTGSMVVVKPVSSYEIGDVVTYFDREDGKKTITHRVVKKLVTSGIIQITTKGDANDVADAIPTTQDLIVGKVFFSVSFIGYLVGAARTTVGFIILIVIPVTIIIYEEIKKIHHETKHIIKKRRERKVQGKVAVEGDSEAINPTAEAGKGNNEKDAQKNT
jgi:signal peptidase